MAEEESACYSYSGPREEGAVVSISVEVEGAEAAAEGEEGEPSVTTKSRELTLLGARSTEDSAELGSATYPNGDAYEGGFLKGDRHHQGKYTYSGGAPDPEGGEARPPRAVYEGLFERGVKSGVGEMTYADSSRYHGEFKDGLRGGSGTMYYASGDTYSGQWSGGLKQGEGTYVYSSGATLTGTWRGGMIEVGSFTDMHGSTFKGSFSGATTAPAYGEGTLTMPSGNAIPVAREGEFMSL